MQVSRQVDNAYQHLDQLCERLDLPIDDFIVPVVCETPERKAAVRKRLYELGPTEQESSILWLSDRTSLDLEHPQPPLYSEVWTTAEGAGEHLCAASRTEGAGRSTVTFVQTHQAEAD